MDSLESALAKELQTRRSILSKTAGVGAMLTVPALLAGCGGDDDDSASSKTTTAAGPVSPAAIKGTTLGFVGFQGDDNPFGLKPWFKENQIKFKPQYTGNDSEVIAKLTSGGSGIDVIGWVNVSYERITSGGHLAPLDLSRIPNYENLYDFFKGSDFEKFSKLDGETIGIPMYVGPLGITYRKGVNGAPVDTWSDLLAPEWKDRFAMFDFQFGNLSWIATTLGYNLSTLTVEQGEKCADVLGQYMSNAKTVASDLGQGVDLMMSQQVDALIPDGYFCQIFVGPDATKDLVTNIEPTQGAFASVEMTSISTKAENVDAAYAMINEMLVPAVNALGGGGYSGVTVKGAGALQAPGVQKQYPYDEDYDAWLKALNFQANPPLTGSDDQLTVPKWLAMYNEVKSSS